MTEAHDNCVLAIVGSRDVPDYQAASVIKQAILEHRPSMVVSGGARGVDTAGVVIAQELGITTVEFKPKVMTWDATPEGEPVENMEDKGMVIIVPGGFKQRNERIAEACDCLVRIASPTTKTYGSGWTADRAEQLGKRVFRYTV